MSTAEHDINETSSSQPQSINGNWLLKACIFATGLAGIVAEYVMSTLASYLLGNSVVQWTLTISIMLFAMGVGSRLSKYIRSALLDVFITLELMLSVLCAVSAITTYFLSIYVSMLGLIIYPISFSIGLLIGLEIPIATRLNQFFEDLRINISSVMEKDYYGALFGGLTFAFIALPYLGLTYTPILLGLVNFAVAAALFYRHRDALKYRKSLTAGFVVVPLLLVTLMITAQPIVLYGEQQKYVDRVIYQAQTPYQRIVLTQWKDNFWLYLNGNEQFSSYDEERYHEPLVHPAMSASVSRERVLVLGGGDGMAVREILKYPEVALVRLVDLDPAVTELGLNHPLFKQLNEGALKDTRVDILNTDAYAFLKEDPELYDVIIIDLPDPKTIELARLYSREFYQLAQRHLSKGGVMVTQAGSPFFSREAFLCILKTMEASGLTTQPYHNHIPTLGEWGWVLGVNAKANSPDALKKRLGDLQFENLETRFLNNDAMISMLHFGKNEMAGFEDIKINQELELALFHYYKAGDWEIY